MARRTVSNGHLSELPEVVMSYYPDTDTIFIQSGKPMRRPIHESETVAYWTVAHYDIDGRLVALELDGAKLAFQPLLEAVRHRRAAADGNPNQPMFDAAGDFVEPTTTIQRQMPGPARNRETIGGWFDEGLDPLVARYTPGTQVLTLQAGRAVEIADSEAVARQLVAHYNAEKSLVALDILDAETTLRPFLDAVLPQEQPQPANPGLPRRPSLPVPCPPPTRTIAAATPKPPPPKPGGCGRRMPPTPKSGDTAKLPGNAIRKFNPNG